MKLIQRLSKVIDRFWIAFYNAIPENIVLLRRIILSNVQKSPKLNGIPKILELFINEDCNLRCHGCTYYIVDKGYFRKDMYITYEYFKEVMHHFSDKINILYFAGGESTLHPDFLKMLDYCKSKGIMVRFSSNGITLYNKKYLLTHPAIDSIGISIDSFDFESFKESRNANIKQYRHLIKSLNVLSNLRPYKYGVSFRLHKNNYKDVDKYVHFVLENNLKIRLINFQNTVTHGMLSDESPYNYDNLLFMVNKLSRTEYPFNIRINNAVDENDGLMCSQLWDTVTVGMRGDLTPCCNIIPDKKYGSLNDHSTLNDNLNSNSLVDFRKNFIINQVYYSSCLDCYAGRQNKGATYSFDNNSWSFSDYNTSKESPWESLIKIRPGTKNFIDDLWPPSITKLVY